MSVWDFLELSEELAKSDKRYLLSNQDVEGGRVKFRTQERLRLLQDLLNHHNGNGAGNLSLARIEAREIVSEEFSAKIGFDRKAWEASLVGIKGPNQKGIYQGQCPSCAARGGDTGHDHLAYTSDAIWCHAKCSFFDIIAGYYKEANR